MPFLVYLGHALSIQLDPGAVADLEAIREVDPDGHDDIVVLLEELEADPMWRDKLLANRPYIDDEISVKRWADVYKKLGIDLRRVTFWNLEDLRAGFQYRVIVYFHPPDQVAYVMAVVNKALRGAFDYDQTDDPTRVRILDRLKADFGGGYGRRR